MEKLKVKITFISGRVKSIESNDYYKGQFKEWCIRNFIKNDYQRYEFVMWNDLYININEIETVEEI